MPHRLVCAGRTAVLALALAFLAGSAVSAVHAQTPAVPPSQGAASVQPLPQVPLERMPALDNAALRAQHAPTGQPAPLRFAEPHAVRITPAAKGRWEQLDRRRVVWRTRIASPGARSINLGFTRYHMPPGGALYLYAPGYKDVIGPFTERDNEAHGELWTPIVPGDEVVVEVVVPIRYQADLELDLTRVNHAFRDFGLERGRTAGGGEAKASGSCNIDVVCPQGDDWREQIRSVGAYTVNGFDTCSGSLVNNTAEDRTPYFLTADHCGVDANDDQTMVVYWNYENSTCRPPGSPASGGPGDGARNQFNSGATLVSDWGGGGGAIAFADMTLVEMDDPIDASYNVYYAGWSREDRTAPEATAIHHPGVEEKRISFEDDPTTITGYLDASGGGTTHIRVADWDAGTTEGGSSGSPLFDENKRVVGFLSGGFAACGNDAADWYGRLFSAWDGGGNAASRLSDWLDPAGTGALTLDGIAQENDPVAPASVTDLSVQQAGGTTATLTWTATGDDGTTGTASGYDVRASTTPIASEADFDNATPLAGEPLPQSPGAAETFDITGLAFGTDYFFALKVRDNVGNLSPLSNVATATTLGPPVPVLSDDRVFRGMPPGTTTTEPFVIRNTGPSDLTFDIEFLQELELAGGAKTARGVAPTPVVHGGPAPAAKGAPDPRWGAPVLKDEGGPDGFGYTWIDSDEPGGPTFAFTDISSTGTAVALSDDGQQRVTLPFDFPFYDVDRSELFIASNGLLAFASANASEYTNEPIPTGASPNALIAPFWDDLDPTRGGTVYYEYDAADNRFIVQYDGMLGYSTGGPYTFQVILAPTGVITFQYESMATPLDEATVGIENDAGDDGLQVAFDTPYVRDGLAVQINPPGIRPDWVTADVTTGTLGPNQDATITLTLDATNLAEATYEADIIVNTNAPASPSIVVPLVFDVNVSYPVELSTFGAQAEGRDVLLTWRTESETNNAGFEVQVAPADGPDGAADAAFRAVGFVEGRGTTSDPQAYRFRARDLAPGPYRLRLKQLDFDGTSAFSPVVEATVALGGAYVLDPLFPNPAAQGRATVRFGVEDARPVTVALYDAMGRRVRTLYQGTPDAGRLTTTTLRTDGLASGVYFVRLVGDGFQTTRRLTVVR